MRQFLQSIIVILTSLIFVSSGFPYHDHGHYDHGHHGGWAHTVHHDSGWHYPDWGHGYGLGHGLGHYGLGHGHGHGYGHGLGHGLWGGLPWGHGWGGWGLPLWGGYGGYGFPGYGGYGGYGGHGGHGLYGLGHGLGHFLPAIGGHWLGGLPLGGHGYNGILKKKKK